MVDREKIESDKKTATCDICGSPMIELHCELICINCGYTRDCSDP